jgi:ATPase family AAA domain-containing protein 3A/B
MFSGFGGGNKKPSVTEEVAAQEQDDRDKGKGSSKGTMGSSVHGFDPDSLERAAKAAKELDRSKNAKGALANIREGEITKQKSLEVDRQKFKVMEQEMAIKRVMAEEQAAERARENETQHQKGVADYKDKLERQRMADSINSQRSMAEEERRKAEESLARQEAIRKKTLEYEAEMRQQTEMAKARAESEGRIKQERTNADVVKDRDNAKAENFRKTVLESIKLAGTTIGNGISEFVTDKEKLKNTAVTASFLFGSFFVLREGSKVGGKVLLARLMKPSLVRETTKMNPWQKATSIVTKPIKNLFGSTTVLGEALDRVILEPTLKERLDRIAVATTNTKKNRAPFRHLLLHGPPGTGKTMFAKGLATSSGLDYAVLTGGDVAPLGKEAVTEIHKVFDWAKTSGKGVLIFVDEADAFLRKRSEGNISEDMRNALNAFLYRTGEASTNFMIVYASNQPEQFDWAINDRIDEMVEFGLPGFDERLKMIKQYLEQYLQSPVMGAKEIHLEGVDDGLLRSIAIKTEGFSGREISKLAIAWQAAAYGTENATMDAGLLNRVLEESLGSKKLKRHWLSDDQIENMVTDKK